MTKHVLGTTSGLVGSTEVSVCDLSAVCGLGEKVNVNMVVSYALGEIPFLLGVVFFFVLP